MDCPDCLSEIPDAARFCRYCGERVEGKSCPDCGARNWSEAKRCRWCTHRFEAVRSPTDLEPFVVVAGLLPTVLLRGRFLRQKLSITRERIVISTPGLFNLTLHEDEIPWTKVAGHEYRTGIFWDQIKIETRGQDSSNIVGLAKNDGQRIRQLLQGMEA